MASFGIDLKAVVVFLTLATVSCVVEGETMVTCQTVGANTTDIIRFPFIASIHERAEELNVPYCCGSVLNPKWVLTAGQCLVDEKNLTILKDKKNMLVSVGITIMSNFLGPKNVENVYRPKRLAVHPQMAQMFPQYDVGMIYLERSIIMGPRVAKAPVPVRRMKRAASSEMKYCTVVSWGITAQADKRNIDTRWNYGDVPLKFFQVRMEDTAACESGLPIRAEDFILCTVCKTQGKSPCMGDIGAPLLCDGRLVGVVSWRKSCDNSDSPIVHTRIDAVQEWVDLQILRGLNSAQDRQTGFVWVLLVGLYVAFNSVKCLDLYLPASGTPGL